MKNILKRIFSCKSHIRPLLNPFISSEISSLGNFRGVNSISRETPIIVSLASSRENFKRLPITIYSLLNQKTKPDRIILWLDEDCEDFTHLPYEITQFIKNGLEIRFVKDLKSYTNIYYSIKEFSSSIIVTADDRIYYPQNWLEKLYLSYISHSNDIQVHCANRVEFTSEKLLPYEKWEKFVNEESSRYDNFINSVGGVLYPPNCFSKEVLRQDIFLKDAPDTPDAWLWTMALVHNRKIRVVNKHLKTLIYTNFLAQLGKNYKKDNTNYYNKQLQNLMKFYSRNVLSKLKSSS